ncbi:MAG TPA: cellulase family glycosylhydrolase [Solirubrobacteraceae bacterium]|jgi:hypothetical protein|nr:cellulase family glycosylhydrolase [Solirubrobacteraceae bacterium]
MRKLILACACCLTLVSGLAAWGAAPALASRDQLTFFDASTDLLNASTRAHTFAQLQSLGVNALRIVLYWQNVAPDPNSATMPKFDATNPASYSWGGYDPVIQEAHKLGWTIMLDVSGPVPQWATASGKGHLTRPDDAEFEQFMEAVGKHYGAMVQLWSIWNEPNQPQFLLPQFVDGVPASPIIYRGLWEFGYKGLEAAGLKNPKVLIGETSPAGDPHVVAPLTFLRGMLCLSSRYRMSSTCARLPAYGYAHHAYFIAAGPYYVPRQSNDVMLGSIKRLVTALNRAAQAGAIRASMPIYLTEFGVQSTPNPYAVNLATQARFDAVSERIAYYNSRIAAFGQYLMRDDSCIATAAANSCTGFQTGLETDSGKAKPLYNGFRLPLAVIEEGSRYSLWGHVRPTTRATTVTVLVERKGSHRYTRLATVHTNSLGYWTLFSSVKATSWRVKWVSPAHVTYEGPPIAASTT